MWEFNQKSTTLSVSLISAKNVDYICDDIVAALTYCSLLTIVFISELCHL